MNETPQASGRNRRSLKNYIILPKFQPRYLLFLIGSSLIPVVFTVAIIFYFLNENYVLLINMAALDPETTNVLQWEMNFMIAAIGASFLVYILCTAVIGVIFSHRIAGVIYKLQKTINEISEGQDTLLYLRDNDEFRDLQYDFNHMIKRLKRLPVDNEPTAANQK